MRAWFLFIAAASAGGCLDATKPVTEDPTGCAMSTSLAGNAPVQIGPLDAANVCLHLDASRAGHFTASTTAELGSASAFTLSLTDVDGQVLRDGWDVTLGDDAPETRASLEWDVPAGTLSKDVVLELRGTALTQLHIQLD